MLGITTLLILPEWTTLITVPEFITLSLTFNVKFARFVIRKLEDESRGTIKQRVG